MLKLYKSLFKNWKDYTSTVTLKDFWLTYLCYTVLSSVLLGIGISVLIFASVLCTPEVYKTIELVVMIVNYIPFIIHFLPLLSLTVRRSNYQKKSPILGVATFLVSWHIIGFILYAFIMSLEYKPKVNKTNN